MDEPYVPIDCEFHDVLESLATRRRAVVIVFRNAGGMHTRTDVIADLAARHGVEYMALRGGTEVWLDRIVSVDGVSLDGFSGPAPR